MLDAASKTILKAMRQLRDVLPENTHATFAKNFTEFLKEHPDSFDIDDISDFFIREEFPATKGKAAGEGVERSWTGDPLATAA